MVLDVGAAAHGHRGELVRVRAFTPPRSMRVAEGGLGDLGGLDPTKAANPAKAAKKSLLRELAVFDPRRCPGAPTAPSGRPRPTGGWLLLQRETQRQREGEQLELELEGDHHG